MPPIYLSVCGWTFVEESQQEFVDHHKEIRQSRVPICRNLSNGDGSSRMTAPAADGWIYTVDTLRMSIGCNRLQPTEKSSVSPMLWP